MQCDRKEIVHREVNRTIRNLKELVFIKAGCGLLRRVFGPKRDEVAEGGENFIMRSFVICTLRQV
jgi:hypothetical protein